jgi:Zn-dependent protease with chaperone function
MTLSFFARLLLLSSASFFIAQLLIGALVAWIAPAAIRRAASMRPERAARLLLALRLLPAGFSTLAVAALCVPSYFRFEPRIAGEEVGVLCAAAAILGAAICSVAMYRILRALIRSALYVRECGGLESRIEGEIVWIVPHNAGVALAGIVHPRLLISERAMTGLSHDQLAVALRHEYAHRASRDNLKRLLILLAPTVFPGLRILEQTWAKCAEWAADDRAAEGQAGPSLALAAALVRVARMQSGTAMPPLVTSLVEADEDLSLRVERLLLPPPVKGGNLGTEMFALIGIPLLIAAIAMSPASLREVHHLLEILLY